MAPTSGVKEAKFPTSQPVGVRLLKRCSTRGKMAGTLAGHVRPAPLHHHNRTAARPAPFSGSTSWHRLLRQHRVAGSKNTSSCVRAAAVEAQPAARDEDTSGLLPPQMTWPGRSHGCGTVTEADATKSITICGWVDSYRNMGGLLFFDVRDHTGLLQVGWWRARNCAGLHCITPVAACRRRMSLLLCVSNLICGTAAATAAPPTRLSRHRPCHPGRQRAPDPPRGRQGGGQAEERVRGASGGDAEAEEGPKHQDTHRCGAAPPTPSAAAARPALSAARFPASALKALRRKILSNNRTSRNMAA